MSTVRTIAVIGAGSSGITAAKCAADAGLEPTILEQTGEVGGNWVYRSEESHSSCYRSLYINTSREIMAYSDFPMPESLPDYPHHTHIVRYFDDYVDQFGIRGRIRFHTRVRDVAPRENRWEVSVEGPDGPSTTRFDAVAVCNGHHWSPRWPEPRFPGAETFRGRQMHSHAYKEPAGFEGRRIVLVGIGNSAVDIAVELSHVADRVYLSTRSGAWVVPKYLFGRPLDHVALTRLGGWIPLKISGPLTRRQLASFQGPIETWGLPRPRFDVYQAHPTISNDLLGRIGHGAVIVKPNVERFDGDQVVFADGSREAADVVIYCTGYDLRFPFFEEKLVTVRDNLLDLYKRVFHPDLGSTIGFIGLIQPLGAIMPIAEMQSRWFMQVLTGGATLPSRADMLADIQRMREHVAGRYKASPRHTIQVDFFPYMDDLAARIGAKPRIWKHPSLWAPLLLGPACPAQYRLDGPGAWPGASGAIRAAYARSRGLRTAGGAAIGPQLSAGAPAP